MKLDESKVSALKQHIKELKALFFLDPFFVFEIKKHSRERAGHDQNDVFKIAVGCLERQEIRVHAPDAGQKGQRHEDHRKKREDLHGLVCFQAD